MLAGGAYVGYKLGKAVGSFGSMGWGGYPSSYYYGYQYGPYYHGYTPYYAGPSRFYGASYNRCVLTGSSIFQFLDMLTKLSHAIRARQWTKMIQSVIIWTISTIGISSKSEFFLSEIFYAEFRYRHVCPQESQCVVTMGRIWPKKEMPKNVTWQTDGNFTDSDPV